MFWNAREATLGRFRTDVLDGSELNCWQNSGCLVNSFARRNIILCNFACGRKTIWRNEPRPNEPR